MSHVTNPSSDAQEVKFEIRLPEKAFIHNFSMTVGAVLGVKLDEVGPVDNRPSTD